MPDEGNRYEVVHGELLVTPAPGGFHQRVITRLARILDGYLAVHGREDLLTSPADISFDRDTLVQPDVMVGEMSAFNRTGKWSDLTTLYLVVEVLSPSSGHHDRVTKRQRYQEQGILTYWIIDIEQQQVEIWTPEAAFPRIERNRLVWRHPELTEECAVDVKRLLTFP